MKAPNNIRLAALSIAVGLAAIGGGAVVSGRAMAGSDAAGTATVRVMSTGALSTGDLIECTFDEAELPVLPVLPVLPDAAGEAPAKAILESGATGSIPAEVDVPQAEEAERVQVIAADDARQGSAAECAAVLADVTMKAAGETTPAP